MLNISDSQRQAVVIGGSIAGLLTARVLTDHFERVTIIERDHLPSEASARKGVPQARHVHILLQRGQLILAQLFPGIERELASDGAPLVDWTQDVLWLSAYGWMPRYHGLLINAMSRDLLEWRIRQHLLSNPKVRWLERSDVTGLLADERLTRVIGVKGRARAHASMKDAAGYESITEGDFDLRAELVVDASGRSSRAPQWLEALGYATPRETVINSFLGYASRLYQKPADFTGNWKVLLMRQHPNVSTRGGGIYPIEGNRWMVTFGGASRDYPPTDEAGFLEFARSLPSPILYETIRDAQPLSDIYGYQRTENRLRHYEEMKRRPENFVLLGDAVCGFNPVYGQGMSVAAMGAMTLGENLRQSRYATGDLTGLAERFQKQLARVNRTPWQMATGEDARIPGVEGARVSRGSQWLRLYMERVMRATVSDPEVCQTFMEVAQLLKPPTAMFHPRIILKALSAKRPHSAQPGDQSLGQRSQTMDIVSHQV